MGWARVQPLVGWRGDCQGSFAPSGLVAEVAVRSQGAAPLCPGLSWGAPLGLWDPRHSWNGSGSAMSSSPMGRLRNGDEDVATPFQAGLELPVGLVPSVPFVPCVPSVPFPPATPKELHAPRGGGAGVLSGLRSSVPRCHSWVPSCSVRCHANSSDCSRASQPVHRPSGNRMFAAVEPGRFDEQGFADLEACLSHAGARDAAYLECL
jgi:hypothetical protein